MIPVPPNERTNEPAPELAAAESVLMQLVQSIKVYRLYPLSNPQVRNSISSLRDRIAALPPEKSLHLIVESERLLLTDKAPVLPDEEGVKELAHLLYLSDVESIDFASEATEQEIAVLLGIIDLSEERRRSLGPLEEVLRTRGVEHIGVRVMGQVKIQEIEGLHSHSWDLVSLAELEELEAKLLKEIGKTAFRATVRTVGEEELDQRASRILGLLSLPEQFSILLQQLAGRKRVSRVSDLGGPIEQIASLVRDLQPFLDKVVDADRIRLYGNLEKVANAVERNTERRVLSARVPLFIRLGRIAALFPERLPGMAVHEALDPGGRLGPGVSRVLLGGLRGIAEGDPHFSVFTDAFDTLPPLPEEAALSTYRVIIEPPAPPVPLKLREEFFRPGRGTGQDFGEKNLVEKGSRSIGAFDSIPVILDLTVLEEDPGEYEMLLEALVGRFRYCLEAKNVEIAEQILAALVDELVRRGSQGNFAALVKAAIDRCGEPEAMRLFVAALSACGKGTDEYFKTLRIPSHLHRNAVSSLMEILAVEPDKSTRHKILDALVGVGRRHVDVLAPYRSHPRWYVVRNVVFILGRLGKDALSTLLGTGVHADPRVRKETVRSLGLLGGQEAIKRLVFYLRDRNESVVREAIRQLVKLKAEDCLPALHAFVLSQEFRNREADTCVAVAQALGTLGREESLKTLDSVFQVRLGKGRAYSPDVQRAFREAAGAIQGRLGQGRA
jgi:HEAT repeat protein